MAARSSRPGFLKALRLILRFGPPIAGLVLIGHAVVISIGGDIERWQFVLGIVLILAGFLSTLVPED